MTAQSDSNAHGAGSFTVYLVLLGALIASLVLDAVSSGPLTVTLIFVIATVKAWLVLTRFVGLSLDPKAVKLLVVTVIALLLILFGALVPDIVWVFGRVGPS